MDEKPFSVYVVATGRIIDQSASEERAKDRLWEISNEDDRYYGVKLAVTNDAYWNQEFLIQ